MTQLTIPNPQELAGQTAFDPAGNEVGPILGVYLDNATRAPEWAAVGVDADTMTLVPLEGARSAPGGLELNFGRDVIAMSPVRQRDLLREVSHDTEDALYSYYGLRARPDAEPSWGTGNGNGHAGAPGGAGESGGPSLPEPVQEVAEEVQGTVATAGEKVSEVASTAKDEAAGVVEAAKEEAAGVAEEVSSQARELATTTRSQLTDQASTQLQSLAGGMHRLAGQARALARGDTETAGPVAEWVGRAGGELQGVAGRIETKGGAGLIDDTTTFVRQRPRAAILGTAVALVAGGKLFRSPAGETLKQKLAPLKEQAVQAGRTVAEDIKQDAQGRVEQVKAAAAGAADQLKADAQDKVQDVKTEAKRSTRAVKGTAKSSAETVKTTAKRSARTTATAAKRSTRAKAAATTGGRARRS